MSNQIRPHNLTLLALPVFLIAALVGPIRPHSTAPRTRVERPASALRTFKVGTHLFGAKANGVVIAGLDHALQIGFRGANTIEPHTASTDADGAQSLEVVTWPNLWDGISLTYRASATGIAESVYTLAPSADAADIQLAYGTPVALNADGSLSLRYDTGQLTESAPIAWQVIDGQRRGVDVQFRLLDGFALEGQGSTVGFTLGAYDPREAVVIDPTLTWHRFVGTSADEYAGDIATDSAGNLYVVGTGNLSWGTPVRAWSGHNDAYVVKMTSNGAVVWSTFLGGAYNDVGNYIAVDPSGAVTVLGYSDAPWGSPARAFVGGSVDLFAAHLSANGDLVWNTFLGGFGYEQPEAIAQEGSGDVIVIGFGSSTWGSPAVPPAGGFDVIVARLTIGSGDLVWNTFIGGTADDYGGGVEVVGTSVYLTGASGSQWGLPIVSHSGNNDGFLARLSLASGVVQWNTFFGGAGFDRAEGITVDGSGNLFVVGESNASWGTPVRAHADYDDIFAARFSAVGVLQWNTFLGGTAFDSAEGVALGAGGSLYVSSNSGTWGTPLHGDYGSGVTRLSAADGSLQWHTFLVDSTTVSQVPYTNALTTDPDGFVYLGGVTQVSWGVPLNGFGGGRDGFVAKLNGAGTPQWHTYLGTGVNDQIAAVALDADNNVYMVGTSNADWGTPIRPYYGLSDVFVAKYQPNGARVWSTFLGSNANDLGQSLVLGPTGDVFVGGYSSATWDTPLRAFTGGTDAFVAKLSSAGALQWHTFLGGVSSDSATGLGVTPNGILATGPSLASWGTPVRAYSSGTDSYVASLASDGTLQWSTFLGGSGTDIANRLSVAPDGGAHIAGYSAATWGVPVQPFTSGYDVFVASVSPQGALIWNTFFGGVGNDYGFGVAADGSGHVFVVGGSANSWGSPQYPHSIGNDAFVARLDSMLGTLQWNTFMGSASVTAASDVRLAADGTVVVTGYSDGAFGTAWLPYTSGTDAFLAEVSATGALQRTAFFGGPGLDVGTAIALRPTTGTVLLGGYSSAVWGDSDDALYSYKGSLDGFIAFIELADTAPPLLLPFIMK